MPKMPMTREACPQCIDDLDSGLLPRAENVQRLPQGAFAPMGMDGRKVCFDCSSASMLMRVMGLSWGQARVAVANDRSEQYRLPGAPIGLVQANLMKPSEDGDFEEQLEWLDEIGLGDPNDPALAG